MYKLLSLFLALTCSIVFSQDGIETGNDIWQWSPDKEYHKAIVSVETPLGLGCGTVIKTVPKDEEWDTAYIVSAAHVYMNIFDQVPKCNGEITYYNGKKVKNCSVVQFNKEADVILIWALCPKGLNPISVSKEDAKPNEKLEFCGLGGKSSVIKNEVRHFYGIATQTTSAERIIVDTYVIHGDSGGAVLNEAGELVGVISGGYAVSSKKIVHSSGWEKMIVFPSLACNANHVNKLLEKQFNPVKPTGE